MRNRFVLMNDEPGAAGGGDDTAVLEAPATTTATAPATPPAATQEPAPSSLAPKPTEFIPEKFRVMNGEALDIEASARKLAESYSHLEKRTGGGELPPKTADEYVVTVPEAFKDAWTEDERAKSFKADALAAGLTQKQFDFVMGKYFTVAPELVSGSINSAVESVRGNLTKAWGEGEAYNKEFNAAFAAFEAYAGPEDKGKFDSIITDPALAYRILARIGPELREAGGIPATAETGQGEDVKTLLTSEALGNPKHPDHAATRAKVDAYYAKKYGTETVN